MGRTVCASCGSAFDEVRKVLFAEICDTCLASHLSSRAGELSARLEDLQWPAALVGRDLVLRQANSRLRALCDEYATRELRVGEALDCACATKDARCGETFFCLQCGVRRVLEVARISGERISRVPVTIGHRSGERRAYTLTAEGTGDTVLFMLEPPTP